MKKLLAVLLFVPMTAYAEFFTGNELLTKINGEPVDRIVAIGYIQGVVDAYGGATICPPPTVTAGQILDMVKNYLTNSPAIRHRAADVLIANALEPVWPCKNRSSGRAA